MATDKYPKCEKCGDALFPWERKSDICGGCILVDNYNQSVMQVNQRRRIPNEC